MFDFGIGSTELIFIAIVALIVIGPKDLPKVLRTVGQVMTKVRGMAREFQGHIEDAAKESGLDDLKKDISKATSGIDAAKAFEGMTNPSMKKSEVDRSDIETASKPSETKTADVKPAKEAPKSKPAKKAAKKAAKKTESKAS